MRRDLYKFLSGLFAGLAVEHAVLAVCLAQGVLNQPQFFGRDWGAASGVFGAALYLILSLSMGYLGWRKSDVLGE